MKKKQTLFDYKKEHNKNDFLLNKIQKNQIDMNKEKEKEKDNIAREEQNISKSFKDKKRKKQKNEKTRGKNYTQINKLNAILLIEIIFLTLFYLLIFFKAIQTPFFYDYDYVFLKFDKLSFITSYELGKSYAFIEPILAIPYFGNNIIQQKIIHVLLILLLILMILVYFKRVFKKFVKVQNLIVTNYEVYALIVLALISILPFIYFFSYGNIFELYLTFFSVILLFSFVDFYITLDNTSLINALFVWIILTLISTKYSLLIFILVFLSIVFAYVVYNIVKKLDLGSFGNIDELFKKLLSFMLVNALTILFFTMIIRKFNILLFPYVGFKFAFKHIELNTFIKYHLFGFLSIVIVYILILRKLRFRYMFYFLSLLSLISYFAYLYLPFSRFLPLMILINISLILFLIGITLLLIGSNIKIKFGKEIIFLLILFFILLNYIFMIKNLIKFDALSNVPLEIINDVKGVKQMMINKTILPLEWQNLISYLIPAKYLMNNFGVFIPLKTTSLDLINKIIEGKDLNNVELFQAINDFNIDYIITLKDLKLNCLRLINYNNSQANRIIRIYDTSSCR